MKVFILMIVAAMVVCSCKSSRNIERQIYTDRTEHFERIYGIADSLFAALYLTRKEVSERLTDMKMENTTTYYSAPDSTGKQYPVKVSETKADGRKKESTRTDTELNATIQRFINTVDSLNHKIDESLKEHEKVAEMSWWDLHKQNVLIVLGLLLLVAAGFLIHRLKR